MKKIILFVFLLISTSFFGQTFSFSKMKSENYTIEMKGKINITDSIISIQQEKQQASKIPVNQIKTDTKNQKYTSTIPNFEANFTLNINELIFIYEFKDTSSNQENKIIYLLDKKNEME